MQPWADAILQAGNPPGIWDTKVGGRKEGHRTLVSFQACSHYPSPFQDSGEGSRSGPPTFTGADSSICAVCTHLPLLVPQLKSISFMVREGSLPLWPSQHLSLAGSVQEPLEKSEACVPHSPVCAIFLKSCMKGWLEATSLLADSQLVTHKALPFFCQLPVPGLEYQPAPKTGAKLVCVGTWQFGVGRWIEKKGDGNEKNQRA